MTEQKFLHVGGVMDKYTYRLDAARKPVRCDNDDGWYAWYEDIDNRRVARTQLTDMITVSTIFTGMDLPPHEPPLLFETEIFGGEYGGCRWAFASWDEAKLGHDVIVAALRKVLEA
jgi:hypothetical protein